MAAPAVITMAVKAAIAAASDRRTRKAVGTLIAVILTPFILVIVMILCLLYGTSQHNNAAIDMCFNGSASSLTVPAEYTTYIAGMRRCFSVLDQAISHAETGMEGSMLDNVRIKAVFYSLYFGTENLYLSNDEACEFVNCFVTHDKDLDNQTTVVPAGLDRAYASLAASGLPVTKESKTNALQIYRRIVYGGAGSYNGEIEYGGKGGTALDGLNLHHSETKNNLDLVAYAENAFRSRWGYVWGTYGDVLTDPLFKYKLEQYPDGVGDYEDFIRRNWVGGRTTDCAGLIKGYGWYNPDTSKITYGTNGMPDMSADGMYNDATVRGSMNIMPNTPGLAVWKSGHIGVYIGNGEVIEAMGTKYGVVKTKLKDRDWKAWLEIPYISYGTK